MPNYECALPGAKQEYDVGGQPGWSTFHYIISALSSSPTVNRRPPLFCAATNTHTLIRWASKDVIEAALTVDKPGKAQW